MNLDLAKKIVAISQEAGEIIMGFYRTSFTVTQKSDDSPLTQADLAAHKYISAALEKLTPDIPVLSEEAANIPYEVRKSWKRYWLVDPLDGTREFVKRNDDFTVNIALVEDGEAIIGVVHVPVFNISYYAARGAGAFELNAGVERRIHIRSPVPAVPYFVITRNNRDAALDALLEKLPAHEAVSRGSALKICLVAAGDADLYPRTGPTSEWDTAAGHCVVDEAGGKILRLPELTPLRYNQKDSLLNPGFVVIGDPQYGWETYLK
ncbi:3'(2'),5'-bisphosphate nucleotidase CysQ [Stenotrophobium rhamnosiphilum]|uniref:3'(2'),5'-bisphosphate nucleotidase CysQ n=1 Tax=Stenotrophobium rhamnosiphilum TaxID=2029166 RepID=A0A2T5MCC7_9GAMM|nr:3'(2'),5'-bisphosphate nucleotidase CysQ [Stenotrophobium rhamnosiphilum]PTU30232.1 3'(2'),5'-bisphosphate nucleotidase [Stenotrophobium rhamnosiphilum]